MCGRFYIDMEIENIIASYNLVNKKNENIFIKKGDIFPTDLVPVIIGKDQVSMAKWGFNLAKNGNVINAKAETLFDKPLFRGAAVQRRCLIPANAFYEWSSIGSKKKKYKISVKDKRCFFMAGIYNIIKDEAGQEHKEFVIVTTEANKEMYEIHDRMPVILSEENIKKWLNTSQNIEFSDIFKSSDNILLIELDEESEQISFL